MNRLAEIIKATIKEQGAITFRQFMELALYCPGLGYYTSARPKLGKEGDFYTSPHVGDVFGRLLAWQMVEMWEKLGRPLPFYLVEYGAGQGLLARDLLVELQAKAPELFQGLVYGIVEISPDLQQRQQELLAAAGLMDHQGCQLRWVSELQDLSREPVVGCIFSNELLDAFPVHLIQKTAAGIREAVVKLSPAGHFVQEFSAPLSPQLEEFLAVAEIDLTEGQVLEVNLAAVNWLEQVSQFLHRGYLLTVDYGYLSPELAAPHRFDGTLLCYEKHQVKENPYENIGQRDITAHVNFTALINYGRQLGWKKLAYLTQGKFLIKLGILQLMEAESQAGFDLERFRKIQQIKQLIMPGGMGDTFKVLLQGKGLSLEEEQLTSVQAFYPGREREAGKRD